MLKNCQKLLFVGLISSLFVAGVFTTSGLALEGRAGEVIKTVEDLKDLEVKGLLTKGQVINYTELVTNGIHIPIVTTSDRTRTDSISYRKYTEMNKGKAKIGPNDELVDWPGQGRPFPDVTPDDPQAGVKVAWNFEFRHYADDHTINDWIIWLTDSKGNVKLMSGDWYLILFAHRTDIDPVPDLLVKNPEGIRRKEMTSMSKPFSAKGLAQLQVKYEDPARENDLWVYVPGLRRNMRVGGGNRCDCLGGFVHNMDDQDWFSGNVLRFNWKLVEVKDHLIVALQPSLEQIYKYVPGLHHVAIKLERRKVWVVEQTPKDPGYCYSKRMYYYDPESGYFAYMEMFDRKGELWKMAGTFYVALPNPAGGGNVMNNISTTATDFTIWEGAPSNNPKIKFNSRLAEGLFTLDYLRRIGR